MAEQIWTNAINAIIAAGQMPVPYTETAIEIVKTVLTEEEAEFIPVFKRPLRMDELQEETGKTREELTEILDKLMYAGVVTGIASRSTGVVVYRLLPLFPGIFEFTLMRGETSEKEKKLARLFDKLFGEFSDLLQSNYDTIVPVLRDLPPTDRIVPVHSQIQSTGENILPADEVEKVIDKFDTIAVANCFCRHEKDLLNEPCKSNRFQRKLPDVRPCSRVYDQPEVFPSDNQGRSQEDPPASGG